MNSFSGSKRKILSEITNSMNNQIPANVKSIYKLAFSQSQSLDQKFKNLEDPLGFIHNQKIQHLVDKTEEVACKLKKQMQETSQFSKSMYKKIISRQGNEFNFQKLTQLATQPAENEQENIMRHKKKTNLRQSGKQSKISQRPHKFKQSSLEKSKKDKSLVNYRHQRQQVLQTQREVSNVELSYAHIKLIDTPEFETKCKNVEFFEYLKAQKGEHHQIFNQQFDIESNLFISRKLQKIKIQLIEQSCENSLSQQIYYDFEKNLRFWKQPRIKSDQLRRHGQGSEAVILSVFDNFSKKEINVNNICDFATGRISVEALKVYLNLKREHKLKYKEQKTDGNLQEMYSQLKKQYDYAQEIKMKAKSQRIPLKYVDSEVQTIRILDQKEFDDYFKEDALQLFQKIQKLSQIRQKAMIGNIKSKFTILKNSCADINECLFKVLTLILKGQKFYPRENQNKVNYAPFFTFNDLFYMENREEVEKSILSLIFTKINQFQCQQVDGVSKADLIRVYVEEKQKNNKILEIIQK